MYIDTHIHLSTLNHTDLKSVFKDCMVHKLDTLFIPGTSLEDSIVNIKIAHDYNQNILRILPFVGLHPFNANMQILEKLIIAIDNYLLSKSIVIGNEIFSSDINIMGIGEIGLDKRCEIPLNVQIDVLNTQLDWALRLKKPVLIHCVGAHNELIRLLKSRKINPKGIIHAASFYKETAKIYYDLGFKLGLGGICLNHQSKKIWSAIEHLPIDAFVTETDFPYIKKQVMNLESNFNYDEKELALVSVNDIPEIIKNVALFLRQEPQELIDIFRNNALEILDK